jgi:hypothetical protein
MPPAGPLAKKTESFREDTDQLLAIQRGHAEVVATVIRRVVDLGHEIECIANPDDPELKPRIETALKLWRLLQDRPLPAEEHNRYTAPLIRHENAKYVQVRLKIDRALWEARVKLFAIQTTLGAAITRRAEDVQEAKRLGQLLASMRDISGLEQAV